jgi:hypothetical protein
MDFTTSEAESEEDHDSPEISSLRRALRDEAAARLTAEVKMLEMEEDELRRGKNTKEVIPEKYDGTGSIRSYLKHFEACRTVNKWNNETAKQWLAARLMNNVTQLLDEDYKTYDELKERLLNMYGPSEGADNYALELRNRKRKNGESLKSLGQSIRDLVGLAYPEITRQAKDRLERDHFKDAVDDSELRQALFRTKPTSMEEAVQAAVEAEAFQKSEKSRRSKVSSKELQLLELEAQVEKLTSLVLANKTSSAAGPLDPRPGPYERPQQQNTSLPFEHGESWGYPSPIQPQSWPQSFPPREEQRAVAPPFQPWRRFSSPRPQQGWRQSFSPRYEQRPMAPPTGQWPRFPSPSPQQPWQQRSTAPPSGLWSGTGPDPKSCWTCGELGHFQRVCPLNYQRPTQWPGGRPMTQ